MASNGFIELMRLADRGIKRQKGEHLSNTTQWLGVAFMLGGEQLVAPLGDVAEVLSMPDITPVPLSKSWLLGVANVRGRLMPITNLGQFLQLPTTQSTQNRTQTKKLLVIDQGNIFSGLLVDDVLGIQTFNQRQYEPEGLPQESPLAAYTHGRFRQNEQNWYIFMPSLLVEDQRYLEAAL